MCETTILFTFLIKYASSLNFQDNKRIEKKECCVIERKTIFYRNRFLMKFKTFNEKRMKKVCFTTTVHCGQGAETSSVCVTVPTE